ncbi:MAG: hypothetical protein IPG50_02140 [Myxococcales bacterium]|nr:hypothetical protein [Myxococcales bacterium]
MARRPARTTWLLASLLLSANVAQAREPTAADRATARALLDEGDRLFGEKNYAAALRAFRGADAIMQVPSTGVEVARAEEALGHPLEAHEACIAVARFPKDAREPEAFRAARATCGSISQRTAGLVATVQLELSGPRSVGESSLRVSMDGAPLPPVAATLPRRLNPGAHVLQVELPGYRASETPFTVGPGEKKILRVVLSPESAGARSPESSPERTEARPAPDAAAKTPSGPDEAGTVPTYAWIALGVAGAGAAVGSVAGLMSLSQASEAKSLCNGQDCPNTAADSISSSKTLANVSNVGFGVMAAGAGVFLVGALVGERASPRAGSYVAPQVGLSSVGLAGRF